MLFLRKPHDFSIHNIAQLATLARLDPWNVVWKGVLRLNKAAFFVANLALLMDLIGKGHLVQMFEARSCAPIRQRLAQKGAEKPGA